MDKELVKDWMQRVDKTPVDIAAALRMSEQTIRNYLNDKPVFRSTRHTIEEYLKVEMPKEASGPEVA